MCFFSAEILLTLMELLTWTSVISWCKEHVGPLKIVQTCNQPTAPWPSQAVPWPRLPSPVFCRLSQPGISLGQPRTDTGVWRGLGKDCGSLYNMPNPPGGEPLWWASLSACPAAFTVVWLTVGPPGGGHWPKGGSSGWDPLFWWMYSSHWTAAIYNLISRKMIYTDFSSFFSHVCDIST